ncbi:Uncharacterised protein [Vibrio cholerae]|uniref:Uncharacterized protein n=1 Tax=Vibrio cholerae TaxID=666 RepID=A0A655VI84_VIBCL|nr:Uncharacterised protein [Vibrio cholerae]CSB34234.1 Uncharacterised protein [Vibrio cholerae]CSB68739.1 Uncharacterised protein [Vibrio cholerae]CSC82974.1 Uncharacterised protein [Vibrio cholerae]
MKLRRAQDNQYPKKAGDGCDNLAAAWSLFQKQN